MVLLLGTFLSATLVRFAPGYGVNENDLNSSLSAETREALRNARVSQQTIPEFYVDFYRTLLRGDLGQSISLQQPMRSLLAERIPVTARSLGIGLLLAWSLALACVMPSLVSSLRFATPLASLLAGIVLSTPAAVLALICLLAQLPGRIAIGLVVFPRVYQFARNILARAAAQPHILTARSKGAGTLRVILGHVLPSAAPQLLSLVGVSICIAFGACIPIEALCDIPGIGQLAWQAALSRDLTLLLDLTMIVTVTTLAANSGMDLAASLLREDRA
jgi:peptide/nickel transport system permease protein